MWRWIRLALTLILASAGWVAWTVGAEEVSISGQGRDQHGQVHRLADLAAGSLVIDFAATWCEPCYKALPKLEALAAEHPEIRFVVVSVDQTAAGRDRLVSEIGLELPVLWDEGQKIVEDFAPGGFPATYVVDHGRLVYHHTGTDDAGWRRLVEVIAEIEGASGSR